MNRELSIGSGSTSVYDTKRARKSGDTQLRFVLTTLRKYKWIVLGLTLLITGLAAVIVWSIQPTFRATASMLFELDDKGTLINIDELVALEGTSSEYLQTQVEILRSTQLASRVVQELGLVDHWDLNASIPTPPAFRNSSPFSEFVSEVLDESKDFRISLKNKIASLKGRNNRNANAANGTTLGIQEALLQRIVQRVVDRTRVNLAKGTNLVKISFDSADPRLSADVPNMIGRLYLQSMAERQNLLTDEASVRLVERQNEIKRKLDVAESKLLEYREANNLIDFKGQVSGLNEQQISVLTQDLLSAHREMKQAELLSQQIQAARKLGIEALTRLPRVGGDPSVLRYLSFYQEAERELNELSNRYLDRHPRVIDARSNLNRLYDNYSKQVLSVASSLEKEFELASANVRNLENQIKSDKVEIQLLSRKQLGLSELERDVEVNRELYDKFYSRVREASESRGLSLSNATVVDPASVPQIPVKPRKSIILGSIFILCLVGFGSSIFVFEDYKDTIQGTNDVEQKLGLNVLGVIPNVKKIPNAAGKNVSITPGSIEDSNGVFLEAIRTLRTSVKLSNQGSYNKIIMITSSVPNEGKSTVAINLAIALARHERILLIEADLRKPSITGALSLKNRPGLADVLAGELTFSQCVDNRTIGGVDLLSAGNVDMDSAELLGEDSLGYLLSVLTNHYDRIIIDTAPIEAVSDALTLGAVVDTTIFVVKASSTTSAEAIRSVKRLQHYGQNLLGAVITQVNLDKVARYGGDYYYQGYFDKYGYGHQEVR